MSACGAIGALVVGGRVVGKLRCDLEPGHTEPRALGAFGGVWVEPTPHRAILEWEDEGAPPDLDLFDPAEGFDVDVELDDGPACSCGGAFPLDSWPGSEYGGHWDTCPARVRS